METKDKRQQEKPDEGSGLKKRLTPFSANKAHYSNINSKHYNSELLAAKGTFISWQGKAWVKTIALTVVAAFLWQGVACGHSYKGEYTDLSGLFEYESRSAIFNDIMKTVAITAVSCGFSYGASSYLGSVYGSAAVPWYSSAAAYGVAGAGSGAFGAYMYDGDIGKGALVGGVTGAIGGGVSSYVGSSGLGPWGGATLGAGVGAVAGAGLGYYLDEGEGSVYAYGLQGALVGGMAGGMAGSTGDSLKTTEKIDWDFDKYPEFRTASLPTHKTTVELSDGSDTVIYHRGAGDNLQVTHTEIYSDKGTTVYFKDSSGDYGSPSYHVNPSGGLANTVPASSPTIQTTKINKPDHIKDPEVYEDSLRYPERFPTQQTRVKFPDGDGSKTDIYHDSDFGVKHVEHSSSLPTQQKTIQFYSGGEPAGNKTTYYYNDSGQVMDMAGTSPPSSPGFWSKFGSGIKDAYKHPLGQQIVRGTTTAFILNDLNETIATEIYLDTVDWETGEWDEEKAEFWCTVGSFTAAGLLNPSDTLDEDITKQTAGNEGWSGALKTVGKGMFVGAMGGLTSAYAVDAVRRSLDEDDEGEMKDFATLKPVIRQAGGIAGLGLGRTVVDKYTYRKGAFDKPKVTSIADDFSPTPFDIDSDAYGKIYGFSHADVADSDRGDKRAWALIDTETGEAIDERWFAPKDIEQQGPTKTIEVNGVKRKFVNLYSKESASAGQVAWSIFTSPFKALGAEWYNLAGTVAQSYAERAMSERAHAKYQRYASVVGETANYTAAALGKAIWHYKTPLEELEYNFDMKRLGTGKVGYAWKQFQGSVRHDLLAKTLAGYATLEFDYALAEKAKDEGWKYWAADSRDRAWTINMASALLRGAALSIAGKWDEELWVEPGEKGKPAGLGTSLAINTGASMMKATIDGFSFGYNNQTDYTPFAWTKYVSDAQSVSQLFSTTSSKEEKGESKKAARDYWAKVYKDGAKDNLAGTVCTIETLANMFASMPERGVIMPSETEPGKKEYWIYSKDIRNLKDSLGRRAWKDKGPLLRRLRPPRKPIALKALEKPKPEPKQIIKESPTKVEPGSSPKMPETEYRYYKEDERVGKIAEEGEKVETPLTLSALEKGPSSGTPGIKPVVEALTGGKGGEKEEKPAKEFGRQVVQALSGQDPSVEKIEIRPVYNKDNELVQTVIESKGSKGKGIVALVSHDDGIATLYGEEGGYAGEIWKRNDGTLYGRFPDSSSGDTITVEKIAGDTDDIPLTKKTIEALSQALTSKRSPGTIEGEKIETGGIEIEETSGLEQEQQKFVRIPNRTIGAMEGASGGLPANIVIEQLLDNTKVELVPYSSEDPEVMEKLGSSPDLVFTKTHKDGSIHDVYFNSRTNEVTSADIAIDEDLMFVDYNDGSKAIIREGRLFDDESELMSLRAQIKESAWEKGRKEIPEGIGNEELARMLEFILPKSEFADVRIPASGEYFKELNTSLENIYAEDYLPVELHFDNWDRVALFYSTSEGKRVTLQYGKEGNIRSVPQESHVSHFLDEGDVALLEFGSLEGLSKLSPEQFKKRIEEVKGLLSYYKSNILGQDKPIVWIPGHGGENFEYCHYINENKGHSTGASISFDKFNSPEQRSLARKILGLLGPKEAHAGKPSERGIGEALRKYQDIQAQTPVIEALITSGELPQLMGSKAAVSPSPTINTQSLKGDATMPQQLASGPESPVKYVEHVVVREGQSLKIIWEQDFKGQYPSPKKFLEAVQENNPEIKDLNKIYPNQMIRIPSPSQNESEQVLAQKLPEAKFTQHNTDLQLKLLDYETGEYFTVPKESKPVIPQVSSGPAITGDMETAPLPINLAAPSSVTMLAPAVLKETNSIQELQQGMATNWPVPSLTKPISRIESYFFQELPEEVVVRGGEGKVYIYRKIEPTAASYKTLEVEPSTVGYERYVLKEREKQPVPDGSTVFFEDASWTHNDVVAILQKYVEGPEQSRMLFISGEAWQSSNPFSINFLTAFGWNDDMYQFDKKRGEEARITVSTPRLRTWESVVKTFVHENAHANTPVMSALLGHKWQKVDREVGDWREDIAETVVVAVTNPKGYAEKIVEGGKYGSALRAKLELAKEYNLISELQYDRVMKALNPLRVKP